MEQYIPKSALVAEIESLLDKGKYHEEYDCAYRDGNNGALDALKNKLNTLEVKELSLEDLKEELDKAVKIYKPDGDFGWGTLYNIAVHFFELGLKQKESNMEKVEQYIKEHTRNCSNEIIIHTQDGCSYTKGYTSWLTPEDARRIAEIAREETIKEVCKRLDNHNDYICGGTNGIAMYDMDKLIEDLKKYLDSKL